VKSQYEEFEVTKGNQNQEIKEGHTTQWPQEKGQTTFYKTLHKKLKIEKHEPHYKPG